MISHFNDLYLIFYRRVLCNFITMGKYGKHLKHTIWKSVMLPGTTSHSRHKRESPLRNLILTASFFIFPPCPRTCQVMPAYTSPEHMLPYWQDVALSFMIDTTKMFRAKQLLIGAIADPLTPVLEFWQKLLITVVF